MRRNRPALRASADRAAHYLTGKNGRGRSAGCADPRCGLFARAETDRNDEEIEYEFPLTMGAIEHEFLLTEEYTDHEHSRIASDARMS